ncbi:hypothetical protein T265_03016 [Opisthorchis viverrini]|uniref:Uncharacterized protein n=1 Tax=Opisthorchis viverrini TaxID=6198 RepID=A0A074ZTT6_OPIVI|nr:hypothetical protein T265_03016 [Opisthorchis viverrini]KER30531.1 hypothetical protein T265_03016 [Opisthorchis viverrini]
MSETSDESAVVVLQNISFKSRAETSHGFRAVNNCFRSIRFALHDQAYETSQQRENSARHLDTSTTAEDQQGCLSYLLLAFQSGYVALVRRTGHNVHSYRLQARLSTSAHRMLNLPTPESHSNTTTRPCPNSGSQN